MSNLLLATEDWVSDDSDLSESCILAIVLISATASVLMEHLMFLLAFEKVDSFYQYLGDLHSC